MHERGFLETQTFIPELLGTMPRAHEPEEEIEECENGEYFKEFYNDDFGQEPNILGTTLLMMCNPSYMRYTERMAEAINDAMTYIRELEEMLARSGNAFLLQDASNGAKSHGELIKEKELYKAKWEASEVKCQLMTELYEQTKEMLLTTTREKVGADTKVSELNAEKYNTRGHMAKSGAAADQGPAPEPITTMITDDKGNLVDVVEVPNSNRFASPDGISRKAKQKMIVVGVTALGWGYELIESRFGLKPNSIKTYYTEGKKTLPKQSKITHTSDGLPLLPWADHMSDDKVPYNYFSTVEKRLINDYCTVNTYFCPPDYITA